MDPVLIPLWPDACRMIGVGRTKGFEMAATGELETVQLGRKRMVPVDAVPALVESLRELARRDAVA